MRTILGLDLGVASIGWAVVKEEETDMRIEVLGSRIIPLSSDEKQEFSSGNAISKNAKRTQKRTQRKGYDRYQQRRENLTKLLRKLDMLPDEELIKLSAIQLWQLRAKSVQEKISLPELGRVLYHLNQKRGYRSSRKDDAETDKKQTEYVKEVNNRYDELKQTGKTIGAFFYEQLTADSFFRCKDRVYPRKAYIEEFDRILACQKAYYPAILTEDIIDTLRNKIIYYQRNLKSCKHLVALCDFEKREYVNPAGKTVQSGPKVAPRSSPLFQYCKLWESINNLSANIKNKKNDSLYITAEQKQQIFHFMDTHEKLKLSDLYKILGISKADGWRGGKAIGNGLPGNTTKCALAKALKGHPEAEQWLQFSLKIEQTSTVNTETGEVVRIVTDDFEQEPLYRLWHTVYSISDEQELKNTLKKQFGISDPETLDRLCRIDFVKSGYGNKSSRAMRRIIPYLQEGFLYSEACLCAGFNHSSTLSAQENQLRPLVEKLPLLAKNELRQPVVEKILNQMIHVVNAAIDAYGPFDEIRVELARELKQSKEERNETDQQMRKNQRENDAKAKRIQEEYALTPTRSRIQKFKLWEESQHKCMYCNSPVNVSDFLSGYDVEIEHILPKALFFDDSFSNKVCSCKKCNGEKGALTAYDYMASKGDAVLADYIERVNRHYAEKHISKTKLERLLTPGNKIPDDFIERQLRESQYIARKAREILQTVCRNVTATSGSVTDFLRRQWGWDEVLHRLNFNRYRELDPENELNFIVPVERKHKNNLFTELRIKDWSKRNDHRHHAIDALTIACTKQGYIQRLNNLMAYRDQNFKPEDVQGEEYQSRKTNLQRYIQAQPHPSFAEVSAAADRILVSFKAGKRVATFGKRYIYSKGKRILAQDHIVVPRGALCEESLYGSIKRYQKNKKGETVLAQQSVIKYPIESIVKDISNAVEKKKSIDSVLNSIVDNRIRNVIRQRIEAYQGNVKKAFAEPLYSDKDAKNAIRSVRCFTGLTAIVPLRYDSSGEPVGYVKPGNNHHVAIYTDREGKYREQVVTFWEAVERKKYGIPAVITRPAAVWDTLPDNLPETCMASLPDATWTFQQSLQQNEMFILGMDEEMYQYAIDQQDYALLNKYLYRVQNIASRDYRFSYHIETSSDQTSKDLKVKKFYRVQSLKAFTSLNPHKVRISLLGKIVI